MGIFRDVYHDMQAAYLRRLLETPPLSDLLQEVRQNSMRSLDNIIPTIRIEETAGGETVESDQTPQTD